MPNPTSPHIPDPDITPTAPPTPSQTHPQSYKITPLQPKSSRIRDDNVLRPRNLPTFCPQSTFSTQAISCPSSQRNAATRKNISHPIFLERRGTFDGGHFPHVQPTTPTHPLPMQASSSNKLKGNESALFLRPYVKVCVWIFGL